MKEGKIMRLPSILIPLVLFVLSGCATDMYAHQTCVRTDKVKHQERFCCGQSDYSGYCGSYCYRTYYMDECVEWACEEGYVNVKVSKEELEWWQIGEKLAGGGSRCVPAGK